MYSSARLVAHVYFHEASRTTCKLLRGLSSKNTFARLVEQVKIREACEANKLVRGLLRASILVRGFLHLSKLVRGL